MVVIHVDGQGNRRVSGADVSGQDAVRLSRARIVEGQTEEAHRLADSFLRQFPGSADALSLAGDAALAAGRNSASNSHYRKAAAIRQPWVTTRKRLAALQALDRQDEALILLARYFIGDPGNIEAAGLLSRIAIGNQGWQSAAVFLDHAIRNGGYRDPALLTLSAEVALQRGDVDLAIHDAGSAYAIQPLNREATRVLAAAYRASGENEEWAEELEAKLARM